MKLQKRAPGSLAKCIIPSHANFAFDFGIELLEALEREKELPGNLLTGTGLAIAFIALNFGVTRLVAGFGIVVHALVFLCIVERRRVHWQVARWVECGARFSGFREFIFAGNQTCVAPIHVVRAKPQINVVDIVPPPIILTLLAFIIHDEVFLVHGEVHHGAVGYRGGCSGEGDGFVIGPSA